MTNRATSVLDQDGAVSLIAHRRLPYRLGVARQPKNFAIESVSISPYEPAGRVRSSATTAVPTRFFATVQLAEPRLVVQMVVRVAANGQPRVTELHVETDVRESITTSTLRRILVDPMLRAALVAAALPAESRPDVHPDAFHVEGEDSSQAWVMPPLGMDERVATAARVYGEAKASGNRAPTEAVAAALGYSRAQAARYVKRARDAGLLPKLEGK